MNNSSVVHVEDTEDDKEAWLTTDEEEVEEKTSKGKIEKGVEEKRNKEEIVTGNGSHLGVSL